MALVQEKGLSEWPSSLPAGCFSPWIFFSRSKHLFCLFCDSCLSLSWVLLGLRWLQTYCGDFPPNFVSFYPTRLNVEFQDFEIDVSNYRWAVLETKKNKREPSHDVKWISDMKSDGYWTGCIWNFKELIWVERAVQWSIKLGPDARNEQQEREWPLRRLWPAEERKKSTYDVTVTRRPGTRSSSGWVESSRVAARSSFATLLTPEKVNSIRQLGL